MAGLEPISTSQITINSFSMFARGRVAGILRPRSTSSIINTYITSLSAIITTYISPIVTIITTHITPIFFHDHYIVLYRLHEYDCQHYKKKLINSKLYHVQLGCGSKVVRNPSSLKSTLSPRIMNPKAVAGSLSYSLKQQRDRAKSS